MSYIGNPISMGIGNKYEQVTDYSTVGANPLGFTRYYNSLAGTNTHAQALGRNWSSTFDGYLNISSNITVQRPDGQQLIFNATGTNWTSDSDVDIRLVQSGSLWLLTNYDDTVETYTTAGLLNTVQARNGYTQTMQYDANNHLRGVVDSFGRSLSFSYAGNLLQTVTTPNGLTLTYAYNSSGVNPGVTDRLASVSYSKAPPTGQTYLYENTNFPFAMTGIMDEDGNRFASWTYDSVGRATSSQHAGGADLVSIGYNDNDGSRNVTNALGLVMVYKFAILQGVPKVTEINRLGSGQVPAATNLFIYDANGYVASNTDWNTNLRTAGNDVHGQTLTNNEAVGSPQARTTTNAYHPTLHLPLQVTAPRNVVNLTYDASGNPVTRMETDRSTGTMPYATAGETRTWTNTYDAIGHVLTTTGPRTDLLSTTTFTYDASNNVSSITDPLGHVMHIPNYTGSGLPLTIIDPNNVATTFTYDARDRLQTRTVHAASGNSTTTFGYDAAGLLTSITRPDGSVLFYQHDAAHRLSSVSNLLGESIVYTLDPAGNTRQETTRSASAAIFKSQAAVFDPLSRLRQLIGASGQTNGFGYDANGNGVSITDGQTNTTTRAFDALNRLLTAMDPLTNSTVFGFDPQDNLTSVTDPRSLITSYVYDGFRRVIQETSPDKGTTVYTLDKAGNRISETDARGVFTLRIFDALNRVISESFPASPGENITYTYDATNGGNFGIGRLTGYTDETGGTTLKYNERGDVISTTRLIGGHVYTTAYRYDLADRVTGITYPSGDFIAYTRDSLGRISSVSLQPGGFGTPVMLATNVTYLPFGPLSSLTYGNGLYRTNLFDLDYRLRGIATFCADHVVQNLTLAYNLVNNIIAITNNLDAAQNQTFAYDPDYRLTGAGGLYGSIRYTYDSDGNRLSATAGGLTQTYTYAATANLLQSVAGSGLPRTLGYTAAGNLTTDNRGGPTNLVFHYGNRNRYNVLSSGAGTAATYNYNALGERLIKTVGTTTTHYHYDQARHLIAESASSGALVREYVWLGDMPLAQIESSGAIHYIHPDHLNTPQKMTTADQTVVWDRQQLPFGETQSIAYPAISPSFASYRLNPGKQFQITVTGATNLTYTLQTATNLNGPWQSVFIAAAPFTFTDLAVATHHTRYYRALAPNAVVTQNLRFPGQYYDVESGLNYNMMRDYDSSLGKYIQNDPIGQSGGLNLYSYSNSRPSRETDTTGLDGLLDQMNAWKSQAVPNGPLPGMQIGNGITIDHAIPKDAVKYVAPDGRSFLAPSQADWGLIHATGNSYGANPFVAYSSIWHYGVFDYQRNGNAFYSNYSDASNFAVGVYMHGAGFTWEETNWIATVTAELGMSSNAGSYSQWSWWKNGWDWAEINCP